MNFKSYGLLVGHVLRGMPQFLKMNFGNAARIADRRLRFMVKYAYRNVPLYRRKYDEAGINPEDIRGVIDLPALPLITKHDIVDGYPDDILARGLNRERCYLTSTSGSTGIPLRIFKSRELVSAGIFSSLITPKLVSFYIGQKLGSKMMSIFVNTPDALEGVMTREKSRLPGFFFNIDRTLDALDPAEEHLRGLDRYQPDVVFTYPSVLRNMAVYAETHQIPVHQPGLMMVSGELLDENTRMTIHRVFNGELLNLYITTECGAIATECNQHRGLHLRSTSVIVELLKDGRPVPNGQQGEVVVTDLWNQATPIIRYSGLRDVAVMSPETCSCRQRHPLLQVVEGRLADSVILPEGRVLHPFSLTLALEHISDIARFQIVQETLYDVRVLLVSKTAEFSTLAQEVEASLRKVLGDTVQIQIDFVEDIPRQADGQSHRVVTSRIS